MNSFGLGLVLNFTDKASVGIMGAVGAFEKLNEVTDNSKNRLTSLGGLLTSVGGTFTALSAPLTGFISKMWQGSLAEASFMENTAIALETLLGSADAAQQHLGAITAFSYETPFQYTPLVAASQSLLAMGKSSEESIKVLRMLGDTAGATGRDFGWVEEVLGVMQSISREGKVSEIRLKQLALRGVDLTNIMSGMSADAVWKQLEVNMSKNEGMMAKMLNTWSGAMDEFSSAMSIAGDKLLGNFIDINEAGDFVMITTGLDRLTASLRKVSAFIIDMADVLAPLGNTVITFIEKVTGGLSKISEWYTNASEKQQKFAATLLQIFVIAPPLLLLGGKFLTMLGLMTAKGKLSAAGFLKLGSSLIPLIAIFGSLYAVMKAQDGILKDIKDSFMNTFGNAVLVVKSLFEYFKYGYMPIDRFNELESKGILPVIEVILQLIRHSKAFFKGFVSGITESVEGVANFLDKILNFGNKSSGIGSKLLKILQNLTNPKMIDKWTEMGKRIGSLVIIVGGLFTVFNKVNKVFKLISNPIGAIITALGLLHYAWKENLFGIRDIATDVFEKRLKPLFDNFKNWFGDIDWYSITGIIKDRFGDVKDFLSKINWESILGTFSNAISIISQVIQDAIPMITWLWDNLLNPLGNLVLDVAIGGINGVLTAFEGISGWISNNIGLVEGLTVAVVSMLGAWKLTELFAFIQMAGGIPALLGKMTLALKGLTIAKIKDKLETMQITAMYAKDFVVGLAKGTAALIKQAAQWVAMTALKIADKVATIAGTVATQAMTAAQWLWNAAMTANPIGLIIAGLVAVIALFVVLWNKSEAFRANITLMAEAIGGFFKKVINGVIALINTLFIANLNKLKIPDWVPSWMGGGKGFNIPEIPYLQTGGEVTETGTAVVHPAEVVVNSDTTKDLKKFLNDYKKGQQIPQTTTTSAGGDTYDNRVYFQAGSIVFQVSKDTSEQDIKRYAEIMMKEIERLQQKKKMAQRNTREKATMTSRRWETVNG